MDELLSYRSEFPILKKTLYLINHSLGAMPERVYDRLRDYADSWATRGIRAWEEGWWEMPVSTGDKIAQIIGADDLRRCIRTSRSANRSSSRASIFRENATRSF